MFCSQEIFQNDIQRKLSVHVLSTLKESKLEDEDVENLTNENLTESNEDISSSNETNTTEQKKIDDILSFKISQCLYPLLKPFSDIPRKGTHSSKL